MSENLWDDVDRYFVDLLQLDDPIQARTLVETERGGLPAIQVSATQGKLLTLLAQMQDSHKILEIGTLGGYSTIWLARGLSAGGKLITLEYEPKHAEVAGRNIAHAGFADRVEIRVGAALDSLPGLVDEAPFDFIFIDANKDDYPAYFEWALKLSRVGTVIVTDNVVRKGEVVNAESTDPYVIGAQQFNVALSKESRVSSTAIQTVGSKGYDGFALSRVERL